VLWSDGVKESEFLDLDEVGTQGLLSPYLAQMLIQGKGVKLISSGHLLAAAQAIPPKNDCHFPAG
jgi:hypothetical protein